MENKWKSSGNNENAIWVSQAGVTTDPQRQGRWRDRQSRHGLEPPRSPSKSGQSLDLGAIETVALGQHPAQAEGGEPPY